MTRTEQRAAVAELYRRFAYQEKAGQNPHFRYKFAREADLKRKLNQALRDLGLALGKVECDYVGDAKAGVCKVRLEICDRDNNGTEVLLRLDGIAGGTDSTDKAPQKALVGAVKYALLTGLVVETGDEPEADGAADDAAADGLLHTLTEATVLDYVVGLKAEVGTFQGGPRFEELRVAYYNAVRRCGGQAPAAGAEGPGDET